VGNLVISGHAVPWQPLHAAKTPFSISCANVSAERLLSGSGLENLYGAIAAVDETDVPLWNASEITHAALKGTCFTARAALDLFCAMLCGFAGNVALTYGARGGIYIAGGIAPRILDYLAASEFRPRFEQKGRF
jgi:glucokinase